MDQKPVDDTYVDMGICNKPNLEEEQPHSDFDNVYCNIPRKCPADTFERSPSDPEPINVSSPQSNIYNVASSGCVEDYAATYINHTQSHRLNAFADLSFNHHVFKAGWLCLQGNKPKMLLKWNRKPASKFYAYIVQEPGNPQLILRKTNASQVVRRQICIPIKKYSLCTSYNDTDTENEGERKLLLTLKYTGADEPTHGCQFSYEFVFNTVIELDEWFSALTASNNGANESIAVIKRISNRTNGEDDFIYAEPKMIANVVVNSANNDEDCVEYDVPKRNRAIEVVPVSSDKIDRSSGGVTSKNASSDVIRKKSILKWRMFRKFSKLYKSDISTAHSQSTFTAVESKGIAEADEKGASAESKDVFESIKSPCAVMPRGQKIVTLINQLNENGQLILLSRSVTSIKPQQKCKQ